MESSELLTRREIFTNISEWFLKFIIFPLWEVLKKIFISLFLLIGFAVIFTSALLLIAAFLAAIASSGKIIYESFVSIYQFISTGSIQFYQQKHFIKEFLILGDFKEIHFSFISDVLSFLKYVAIAILANVLIVFTQEQIYEKNYWHNW